MQPDKMIKEYLDCGGKLFSIRMVDAYRDGGTKVIHTTFNGDTRFYINKETDRIHTDYPLNHSNMLRDELLQQYLIHVLDQYLIKKFEESERNLKMIANLKYNTNYQFLS